MQHSIQRKRLTSSRRAALFAIAALGVLVSGCGASTGTPNSASSAASVGSATAGPSSASTAGTTSSGPSAPATGNPALAFAECMRANGLPSFPDPQPGRGGLFQLPAGANPSSPAFKAAQAKCRKFMGGPPGPGSATHPSPQTMTKLRMIAVCMRAHGVPQFPDPRTSVPSNPAGIAEITDFDGAILLFPATMNLQAPAYKQALAACGAPPLGLPH